jgi:predicted acyl esterase
MKLAPEPPSSAGRVSYAAEDGSLRFFSTPVTAETEITGPIALKLWASSSTRDTDLFVSLGIFDPEGREVTFIGTNDPRTPIGLGWLRASHRKIDPARSTPWRPFHTHDEAWPLTPGVPVELEVEIWPTCIVIPPGYRIGLRIAGRDYEYDGTDAGIADAPYPMKGVGPFIHTDLVDRPPEVFGGTTTLHFGPDMRPYALLPIIPGRQERGQ